MKHNIRKLLIAAMAGITLIASTPLIHHDEVIAAKKSSKKTSMRKVVQNAMKKGHVRGSVVVVKNGKAEQISYGYGYYGKRLGAGNHKVLYPLGSLQKVLTGAMITQLIYAKKFNQNTKISRWYPGMKNAKKITVGQLMTHTSGINVVGTESNAGINYSEQGAINRVVSQVNSQRATKRGKFNYNNANFILLAGIIRKVTGKSYAWNLKKRIVKPLKLKNTYIYKQIPKGKTDAISYTYSHGRNYQDPRFASRTLTTQLLGAGDVFSTPKDYYKIIAGLQNGKILTKKQFKYMTHLKAKDKSTTYSGGIYMRRGGKLEVAYGNFGNTHFANWLQLTSDNKNGIVMFLNQTTSKNKSKDVGYKILKKIKSKTFVNR